jgi:hypothetical protein
MWYYGYHFSFWLVTWIISLVIVIVWLSMFLRTIYSKKVWIIAMIICLHISRISIKAWLSAAIIIVLAFQQYWTFKVSNSISYYLTRHGTKLCFLSQHLKNHANQPNGSTRTRVISFRLLNSQHNLKIPKLTQAVLYNGIIFNLLKGGT